MFTENNLKINKRIGNADHCLVRKFRLNQLVADEYKATATIGFD